MVKDVDELVGNQASGARRGARRARIRQPEVWTLVVLEVLTSATCFLAAVAPLTGHRFVRPGIIFGSAFALLAIAIWLCANRLQRPFLFAATVIGTGLISAITSQARTAAGAALICFTLVWTTIYAASFFTILQIRAVLILIAIGSMAGLAAQATPRWEAVWLILNTTTVTTGLVVGRSAERLRRDAETDELTGVLNRRGFFKAALLAHSVSGRVGGMLALVIVDLDNFKAVNDRAGHQGGDQLLVEATQSWQRELREGDLLCRYGGDEFVLLLPVMSAEEIDLLLARLRRVHPIRWTGGAAIWERDEEIEDALHRADSELYAQKARRRIP